MKNPSVYTAIFLLSVSVFVSCKKESALGKTDNTFNDIVETKPAIQVPVSYNVNGNIGGYQEALPALYDSTTKTYPLLIFIHGIGELGNGVSDLWAAANIGTPGLIRQGKFPASFAAKGRNFSFIVVSPQFKAWPSSADVNAMINYAINKYRIDTTRIYVSGLSMGGGATWEYAVAYNNRVSAIAPICGASGPNDIKAQKIAQGGIAVWAFHNQDDVTVTPNNSTGYVNKINAFNPPVAARISLWPSGGHDAWTKATDPNYRENGMNMYEWMLQFSK